MNALGPRVLVVDDDQAIRRFLRIALQAHGYRIFEAGTLRNALAEFQTAHPDVVILDLSLPDGDGLTLTRQIRGWAQTPIMILSVRGQEEAKVALLDAGADDYLTKPFGTEELLARLRVLLRHLSASPPGEPFRSGDLEVDVTRRLVKVSGQGVHCTPTEYELLKALVSARGKVLTHQQLLRQVWGPEYAAETHLLRVTINTLRRKLEGGAGRSSYIITEPRIGYRLRTDDLEVPQELGPSY